MIKQVYHNFYFDKNTLCYAKKINFVLIILSNQIILAEIWIFFPKVLTQALLNNISLKLTFLQLISLEQILLKWDLCIKWGETVPGLLIPWTSLTTN